MSPENVFLRIIKYYIKVYRNKVNELKVTV